MKRRKALFFMLGWTGMVLYFTERWIFGPLIPSLMEEFHETKTVLGVIGSGSLWGYTITPVIAGILSDRFGRKLPILFGIAGFSALTVVCGMVSGPMQLFLFRFFTGIAEAFFFLPLVALTLELFPERPGFYVTFMASGSSLGWAVGPALSGWLLNLTGNWRWPFLVTGVAGLCVWALLWKFFPPEAKTERPTSFFDRTILTKTNLLMLFLLALTNMFEIGTEFGFTMWFPVFLQTEVGMAVSAAGLVAGLYGVGQFFGRPLLGFISDRVGYRELGICATFLQGLAFVAVLGATNPFARSLFTFGGGLVGSAVIASLLTFTGLTFPRYKGLALGLTVTFGYATSSLAPIAIGYIGDRYTVGLGLWTVCVPTAFAASLPFLATYLVSRMAAHRLGRGGE
jgi:MFS family permease